MAINLPKKDVVMVGLGAAGLIGRKRFTQK